MLILPPGHGEMLRSQPKLAGRERRIVAVVGALAAVVAAVTIFSLFVSPSTSAGCVDATVPGVIGATTFHECGAAARQLCATPAAGSGLSPYGLGLLRASCRKAGFRVPAAPARQ